MAKLLFLINPKSGKAHSKKNFFEICELFSSYQYDISLYFTKNIMDAYNYCLKHGSKYDLVVVSGGDGTINEVTNALMKLKKKPQLGYFPSGTMNDFGSNFNLSHDYLDIAKRIMKNKTKPFDVSLLNNRYFNYVAGFGSFTDVSYKTKRESKEALGSLAYFLEGIASLQHMKPIKTKITIGKKSEELNVLFGLIFSGNRVAGIDIFKKRASINDGIDNVVLVEYTSNIFEMGNYLALLSQKDNKYIHWYKGNNILFEFDEDVSWTLDGEEVKAGKKAKIEVFQNALEMLC